MTFSDGTALALQANRRLVEDVLCSSAAAFLVHLIVLNRSTSIQYSVLSFPVVAVELAIGAIVPIRHSSWSTVSVYLGDVVPLLQCSQDEPSL